MMYIQSRKRKWVSPFSSFLSNSFLLFSPHFPPNLNCQSSCKRKKSTHSEDPNTGASSSPTNPHGGDHEGGEEQRKGNSYEVFLSFRGEDTRKNFTDYLYTSLVDAGIHVFKDNNELPVGEEIGQQLLHSITQSKILIPIMSENYASSQWCLRELAHMLKCKRNRGQIVLPIFYKVKPSKLRNPTRRLRNTINAHKNTVGKKVAKEWEEALKEVTSLKGWESEKIDNGHEGTLVKIVVRKVISELKRLFLLNVPKQLVGIDNPMEHIMSFTDAKFSHTRIIGIYGMGGIGKTTLAKVLYNKLSSHYDYRSFVADVREESKRKGIVCIQKQLISDLKEDLCDVSNVDEGINILESRFTSKKVLILLDDVDDDTHLKALVEDGSWFKAGSIVIITTRDKDILDKARVSHKYQLNELLLNQSLILFSRHAFRKDSPPSDYGVISRDIVSTTGGLPLALEVIGSCLCGKTKKEWEATSKKLQKVPNKKVQDTLRISYDTLDYGEKQIFLDIACFFIGSSKRNPTYMWDACDFYPGEGLEVLRLKSLIKIDQNDILRMHDQLRDLGREIVRLENPQNPQERSRVWISEDAAEVIDNKKPLAIAAFGSGNATVGPSLDARGAPVAAMVGMNSESMAHVNPRIAVETGDKSRNWKLKEINEPSQCQSIRLPDNLTAMRVSRLIYTKSGLAILALSSDGVHKLWKWQESDPNFAGKATTSVVPRLWQAPGGNFMTNDIRDTNPEDAVPCFALSKNNSYLISASGGKITLFNVITFEMMWTFTPKEPASTNLNFHPQDNDIIAIRMEDSSIQIYSGQDDEVQTKLQGHRRMIKGFAFSTFLNVLLSSSADSQVITTFMPPPPAATFLAFHPEDSNIIVIGMEDSSIYIYESRNDVTTKILRGHQERITGLAFSTGLQVLVSSGADSQLRVWSTDTWENRASRFLQMPTRLGAASPADTRIQFNVDKIHLLVVHETQIATYEVTKLACLEKWVTRETSGPITDATYSCNGQSIYVSFEDGSIGVFTASTLRLRCRINPTAYIPPNTSLRVYTLVITAHPSQPNQFAVGLTDGSIHILEPLECEGKWGTFPPLGCNPFRSTPKPPPIATIHSGNATVGARPGGRGAPVVAMVGMISESMADAKPRVAYESRDKSQIWKLTEVNEPLQCRSIRLPDIVTANSV